MRPDEKANQLSEMVVYLNGKPLGTIMNNETKQFEIPAGKHSLEAKIDSQGSKVKKFTTTGTDNKVFVISTDNEANSPEPLIASGTFLDVIIGGLQLLYYFTIGHNRYLRIDEPGI